MALSLSGWLRSSEVAIGKVKQDGKLTERVVKWWCDEWKGCRDRRLDMRIFEWCCAKNYGLKVGWWLWKEGLQSRVWWGQGREWIVERMRRGKMITNWNQVSEIWEDLRMAKMSKLDDFGAAAQPNLTVWPNCLYYFINPFLDPCRFPYPWVPVTPATHTCPNLYPCSRLRVSGWLSVGSRAARYWCFH